MLPAPCLNRLCGILELDNNSGKNHPVLLPRLFLAVRLRPIRRRPEWGQHANHPSLVSLCSNLRQSGSGALGDDGLVHSFSVPGWQWIWGGTKPQAYLVRQHAEGKPEE
jgi:hypothetical protein